jgi:hypothetical protein
MDNKVLLSLDSLNIQFMQHAKQPRANTGSGLLRAATESGWDKTRWVLETNRGSLLQGVCVTQLTAAQCLIWQLTAAVTKLATATSYRPKLVSVNYLGLSKIFLINFSVYPYLLNFPPIGLF